MLFPSHVSQAAAKELWILFTNALFVFLIDLYQLRVIKTPQLFGATSTQRHAQSPPSQRAGDIVNAWPLRRKPGTWRKQQVLCE